MFRLLAAKAAVGSRDRHALARASSHEIRFGLGDHPKPVEQEPAYWVAGVMSAAPVGAAPLRSSSEAMSRASSSDRAELIQCRHDEGVSSAAGGKRPLRSGPTPVGARESVIYEDLLGVNAERPERVALRGQVLSDGRDARSRSAEFEAYG